MQYRFFSYEYLMLDFHFIIYLKKCPLWERFEINEFYYIYRVYWYCSQDTYIFIRHYEKYIFLQLKYFTFIDY